MLKKKVWETGIEKKLAASKFELYLSPNHKNCQV